MNVKVGQLWRIPVDSNPSGIIVIVVKLKGMRVITYDVTNVMLQPSLMMFGIETTGCMDDIPISCFTTYELISNPHE